MIKLKIVSCNFDFKYKKYLVGKIYSIGYSTGYLISLEELIAQSLIMPFSIVYANVTNFAGWKFFFLNYLDFVKYTESSQIYSN